MFCYALKSSPASFQRSVVQRTFRLGEFRSIMASLLELQCQGRVGPSLCVGGRFRWCVQLPAFPRDQAVRFPEKESVLHLKLRFCASFMNDSRIFGCENILMDLEYLNMKF